MPHGYCTECRAQVTVRNGQCLLDHVVDPSSSQIIASKVSSRDVQERMMENSYHVATLDNDAPAIFEESVAFIRRVARQ